MRRRRAATSGPAADRSAANYAKITERVRRDEATVLQPLRAAMIAAAASAPDSLSEELPSELRSLSRAELERRGFDVLLLYQPPLR